MSELVSVIEHKGKQIVYINLDGKSPEDSIAAVDEATILINSKPEKSVLMLTNIAEAHYNADLLNKVKEFSNNNTPYIKKSAVFGISGMSKIALGTITKITGRDIKTFDDIETAKDWLCED